MSQPGTNLIVKIAVPVVLTAAIVVGVKSCSDNRNKTPDTQTSANVALKNMSPEDLKALGVEGDTPQDTLRTIVGNFRRVQDRLDTLAGDNKKLNEENAELKKTNSNVDAQINEAVANARADEADKRAKLSAQVSDLSSQVGQMLEQLKNKNAATPDKSSAPGSDIPIGLGYDNGTSGSVAMSAPASDGLQWVEPKDGLLVDASGKPVNDSNKNSATGFSFASSFGEAGDAGKQAGAAVSTAVSQAVPDAVKPVDPVFTLPENATLVGSRAMTALLGRVPIDGKVTDPYPFKVMLGKDNLTANGIELPDVQGAIVSGTATGDWTLSCVRGSITSITFVFADGTVRTLPAPDSQNGGGNNQNSQNSSGNGNSSIGWISDDNGIPCISGTRKSNASTYLPTIIGLAGAAAAGDAVSQNQMTGQTNAMGGVTQTLTGDAGQAVLGKALSGSMKETVDWVKARYGQTFDAIYVPPGQTVALHITRQLAIDYEEKGRKVKYDFSLAGSGTGMD
ncbi:TIGR03752 family integrating conjugative element protein [Pantoea stewartii]|uniref:TIGR03752 family integrating conjugative element protein n=1 Tax=Pantoea stewartii TaxID=66269 RepID=UPI002DBEB387|nr:TIGR03752 family integrating conjugative element protein [Pantoea stewartii]MEB6535917.1 TIGR03752 family integrating conjugative element protein [Pantoea stewartii]